MYKAISESELIHVLGEAKFKQLYLDNKQFMQALYSLGMDCYKSLEAEEITHRNSLGQVVHCRRFVGPERLDLEWVNSGYASDEARYAASDRMLRGILRGMLRTAEDPNPMAKVEREITSEQVETFLNTISNKPERKIRKKNKNEVKTDPENNATNGVNGTPVPTSSNIQ